MFRNLILIISSLVFVIVIGCEGPEGPTGPEGPQGEQGPGGPQGPAGTANVSYSDWIAFSEAAWSDSLNFFGQARREYPVSEDQVTEEIINSGTVAVYVRFDTVADRIFHLPVSLPLTSGNEQQLDIELEIGTIRITFHNITNNNSDPGTFGEVAQFRYIIIPGGTPAKSTQPDYSNYHEVISFYGIKP